VVTSAVLTLTGGATADRFGEAVAGGADLTGDGRPDMLVGASGTSAWGQVSAFAGAAGTPGSAAAFTLEPIESTDNLGLAVADAGDVNSDGYEDLLVGAPGVDRGQGAAYLYLGGAAGPSTAAAATLRGATAGERFGWALSGAGDVNGDGTTDAADMAALLNAWTG
jgi:hypothetical protein